MNEVWSAGIVKVNIRQTSAPFRRVEASMKATMREYMGWSESQQSESEREKTHGPEPPLQDVVTLSHCLVEGTGMGIGG